jgi:hypothetical protein
MEIASSGPVLYMYTLGGIRHSTAKKLASLKANSLAGNFHWCKISRNCMLALRKKFSFSRLLHIETTPTPINCMYDITRFLRLFKISRYPAYPRNIASLPSVSLLKLSKSRASAGECSCSRVLKTHHEKIQRTGSLSTPTKFFYYLSSLSKLTSIHQKVR